MGHLLGKQWQARDLANLAYYAGFSNAEVLTDAVMVCLAESMGYERAYNDNLDANGKVVSRDVGLWQINIPASEIGTQAEENLYDPATNVVAAHKLWSERGFEPWVSFTGNVYLRDVFLERATRGVGNFLADERLKRTPTDTLAGTPYVHTLTTPVLDYEYRVIDQHNALQQLRALLLKAHTTTGAKSQAYITEAISVISKSINIPKQ